MAFGKYAVDYEQRVDIDRLRKERLQRAREQMEKDGIGTLVTWDHANIRYTTSYYVTTPMRAAEMTFVVLPRNGEPILFGAPTASVAEKRMPWMEGRVRPSLGSPKVTAKSPEDLGVVVGVVGAIMAEHGLEKEPVGLDGSTLEMWYAQAFSNAGYEVAHAKPIMDAARQIKTQDEIELMRITCANSEKAFAAIAEAIRPGVRECDLVGIGIKALYEEGVDHTEDLVCCSGYYTNPFTWSFTDKPIRPGDLIYIDVDGACYLGYMSCVYRTFCCGKAAQEQKELYEECRSMLYAGIEAIKPGNTTYDVLDRWPDSPSYWGFDNWLEILPYAIGHGIGLSLHEGPTISPAARAVGMPPEEFREGMVIAVETWVGKRGGKDGVRLEEDVLVTKDGCEVLTKWPIDELMECWK